MTQTSHIMNLPRYFVVTNADWAAYLAAPTVYEYHFTDLDSLGTAGAGHKLVVMRGAGLWTCPGTWQELPHLLDSATSVPTAISKMLADLGVTAGGNTFKAAMAMSNINKMYMP